MGVAEDETAGGPVIPGVSWAVYLLQCSDGTYYTGSTAGDVTARVSVHNTGKGSKYVRSRLPAILAYTEVNYTRVRNPQARIPNQTANKTGEAGSMC